MQQEYDPITIPSSDLESGLASTDLPGESVAHIRLAPDDLQRRYNVAFQQSFDNLDDLVIALIEAGGNRFALIHHDGMPADETEVYADREAWERRDLVEDFLNALRLRDTDVLWRREWLDRPSRATIRPGAT